MKIQNFNNWLNESAKSRVVDLEVSQGDVLGDRNVASDHTWSKMLNFIGVAEDEGEKPVAVDPDVDEEITVVLNLMVSALEKEKPVEIFQDSNNLEANFDEFVFFDDLDGCGKCVRASHSKGQYNLVLTSKETYLRFTEKKKGPLSASRYGL